MKLYLMKIRLIYNSLYILKKSEIIKLSVFFLMIVLFSGITQVLSEDFERYEPIIYNIPFNKEAMSSPLERIACIPLSEISIYMPFSFLADYLGLDVQVSYDRKNVSINISKNAPPDVQVSESPISPEAAIKQPIDAAKGDNKASGVAYLTFDDGLDRKVTPQVLDILKQYEVKATFFILGNSVSKNKDILKRIIDEGHNVGNHTYTHRKDIIYTNVKNFSDELAKTSKAIYDAVGIDPKLFRPPYGAPYIRSQEYKDALAQYKIVLWNVDSMDSRVKGITGSGIAAAVIGQLKNKQNAIILFHSTSAREETAKALPEIIEYLMDNGYNILRLE